MVEGRLSKIAKTLALLEQPFIKDSSKTVAEHIKEAVAGIGENIRIRRFTRYNLGEVREPVAGLPAIQSGSTGSMSTLDCIHAPG